MNLAVDIGNTRIKAALYEYHSLKQLFIFNSFQELQQDQEFSEKLNTITNIIISNVAQKELLSYLQNNIPQHAQLFILQLPKLQLPFTIDYLTPHTLGSDRIAAAAGGIAEFNNASILIIDAGTCIKYNLIHNKTFLGGAISPGLLMRYKALHYYTGQLPLLHPENPPFPILGKTTNENLHSGIVNGCLAEIHHYITYFEKIYPELKIILTGGDATFFEKLSERKVFLRPYLILDGLNTLLEYQKHCTH